MANIVNMLSREVHKTICPARSESAPISAAIGTAETARGDPKQATIALTEAGVNEMKPALTAIAAKETSAGPIRFSV